MKIPCLAEPSKNGSASRKRTPEGITQREPRLKPRKPDSFDMRDALRTDPDDPAAGVEIVKVIDGRPVVRFVGMQPLSEELERSHREFHKAVEEMDTLGVLYREEKERRDEQADVEEGNRIKKNGTLDQQLRWNQKESSKWNGKARSKRLGETMSQGAAHLADADDGNHDGYGGDTRRVVADEDNDHPPDIDDGWQYEGFTGHQFWEAVHPPMRMPGDKRSKYPPIDKQVVPMPRWLHRVTKVWPERVMLALLVYYFQLSRHDEKIRARRRFKGHLWVAKDDKAMAIEVGLAPRLVKEYRSRLVEKGLIIVEHHRFAVSTVQGTVMLRVCHYRLNWNALEKAYIDGGGDYEYLEDKEVAGTVVRMVKKSYGKKEQTEVGSPHWLQYHRRRDEEE